MVLGSKQCKSAYCHATCILRESKDLEYILMKQQIALVLVPW
jgi:hypothetical protein